MSQSTENFEKKTNPLPENLQESCMGSLNSANGCLTSSLADLEVSFLYSSKPDLGDNNDP